MKALTVLVVDDDKDFAESLGDLVRFYGHTVREEPSAERALLAAEANTFDLIFLDIRMPGQSGLDVYPKLREARPQACIVFSTAFIDDVDRRSNRQVMHAELLEKPSGINRLESVLRRVAGEFELLLVGPAADTRELYQALRHRGYQVLRADNIKTATETVSSTEGDKVAAVVGPFNQPDGQLISLDTQLDELGMALPIISLCDPDGLDVPMFKPPRVQRLAVSVSVPHILDAVDRGAEFFVV